mgnify:CR=1 FL=1
MWNIPAFGSAQTRNGFLHDSYHTLFSSVLACIVNNFHHNRTVNQPDIHVLFRHLRVRSVALTFENSPPAFKVPDVRMAGKPRSQISAFIKLSVFR